MQPGLLLEHAFKFAKGTLGLTAAKVRTPQQADRWVRLVMAASAELLLARPLAADLRRPWERPAPAGRLTPARVRRGEHPREGLPARRCAETRQARPGQAARVEEPPPGTTPRRGKNDEEGAHPQGTTRTRRLNGKLRACPETGPVGSDPICFRADGGKGPVAHLGRVGMEVMERGPDDRDLCRSTDLSGPRYLRLLRQSCAGAVPAGPAAVPGFRGTPQT